MKLFTLPLPNRGDKYAEFFCVSKVKKEFERIQALGKICNDHHGPCSVGTLFEDLLGKKADQSSLPDYEGIEIKTKKLYQGKIKQKYFTLFHEKPHTIHLLISLRSF